MKFTDIFIRRPVLAIVVNLVIVIAGIQALGISTVVSGLQSVGLFKSVDTSKLPAGLNVRQYPRSENAAVTVTTVYVGADANLVRGFITQPLERAIAAADGIEYLQSESGQSVSTITARLKLNFDATKALAEISSKVDQVRGDLPPEAEVPIINIVSADSEFASAYLSFSSDILEQNEITDYLVRVVQPRLSALEGVQRAEILGARTFALRAWLKPDRMAALNISPAEVRRALAANNYLAALGATKGELVQVNMTANTDLRSVEEFKRLIIREQNGAYVRLEDVADVVLGAESYDAEVLYSGKTATFMGMFALPNANSIDVIKRVRAEMAEIERELPSGLTASIAYDSTAYINNAIHEVVSTLTETLIIVMIVIFLFLGTIRSVFIPIVAIPVSLIGAFFLMLVFGFSINLLTLLAIVLSVGLVVDDAIVVVENVERHMREGRAPIDAAILGARELVGPIIAMTITLAAVYAPIGFQGGLTGSLFREFAFTLAGAVMISGVVAITLSPMMAGKLLRADIEHHWLPEHINKGFELAKRVYGRLVDFTLAVRPAVWTVWIGLSVLAVPMFMFSPKEPAPSEDQGVIFGIVQAPSNATLDQTRFFAAEANKMFDEMPETQYTFQITFANGGFGGVVVSPWNERERKIEEIVSDLQGRLGTIPGIQMFPVTPPPLPGGGSMPVEFVIASTAEPEQMLEFARTLVAKAAAEPGLFYFPPLIDTKIDQPQAELVFDREKVAALGLNLQQVGADVGSMLGGNYVNRFSIAGRSYKVIPQISRVDRLNPDQIENIYVSGPNGQLVPLSTIASIRHSTQPRSLNRFQQLNAITISGVPGKPLDEALRFLEDEAARILPKGYVIDYTGQSRQLRTEGNKFLPMLLLACILIFLVLAAQFNSFSDPIIILLGSVPLAMFGALIFSVLKMPAPGVPSFTNGWTTSMNIYSQIGLVTLVGLVSKNGILIVEFANQLQRQGLPKIKAIREAAITRLRPVLMTTAATVFGHFPLTLVSGPGAAARNSIGIIIVAGMSIGTVFTLFVIPSIYMLFARDYRAAATKPVVADQVMAVPANAAKEG